MIFTRRGFLGAGGGIFAALILPPLEAGGEEVVDIRMAGRPGGSHVWFDPVGIRIRPGQTVRWMNLDPGNAHTATAYHPANFDRPRRIPQAAEPWDSDYLLPNESFSATLTVPGVYDYFCAPHEQAGMVGRIVVGEPDERSRPTAGAGDGLPEAALAAFPPVEEIMRKGIVRVAASHRAVHHAR